MTEQEFTELSAGHALGALSPEDERAYTAALVEHPAWATIARDDAESVAALGDRLPAIAPPAALRADLLSAISRTPQLPAGAAIPQAARPATPARPAPSDVPFELAEEAEPEAPDVPRRNLRRTMVALVASVAVLSMIALGTGSLIQSFSTPAEVSALRQIESAPDASEATTSFTGGVATVHWSEAAGKAVIVASGLPSLDDERAFELWYVRGETPISAGTFSAKNGVGTALLSGEMQPGDLIAVTIEDAGGSPTGLPTTDPILAVETA